MTLNPTIAAMLDKARGMTPFHVQTVQAVRATDPARYALGVPPDPVASVEDRMIPGPGGDLRIRIFRPDEPGLRPVVVYFHGGGYCLCSVETHSAICRQLCRRSGAVVVSVDYRLAPEAPFPAGLDDCDAAARWVAANAAALGGDPARIAVAGDSAGATFATAVARRFRDAGGPALAAQVLLVPVTDHYTTGHPSYTENADGYGLTAAGMRWFFDHYVDPARADDPDVSPLRAASVAGLPRTYLATAQFDPLRDEGEAYGQRLRAAGVEVTSVRHPDAVHAFFNWVGLVDTSGRAMDAVGRWLRVNL